jgi:hypothetical protein
MKTRPFIALLLLLLTISAIGFDLHRHIVLRHRPAPITVSVLVSPVAPEGLKQYTAALEVARIFGRSTNGCAEADPKLITTVAAESIAANVDPRVLAALIAIESGCNQFATSSKGAIGLGQIVARTWRDKYDFEHAYNLLNPRDNIHVTADILGGLIKQYGAANGLRRYSGLGTQSDAYDAGYPDRVQALAAKR